MGRTVVIHGLQACHPAQIGIRKHRETYMGLRKISPVQIRLDEPGFHKIGFREIDFIEAGSTEIGSTKVDTGKLGFG
jgi:hypothetical protein